MTRPVDHIIWAASDLDRAVDRLHGLTGVRATPGGVHPGRGTRNALIALGPDCYLEILAPDPAQPLDGTFGESLSRHSTPQIIGVMLASSDLDRAKAIYSAFGVECNGPFDAERQTPEGTVLRWRLLIPIDPPWGDLCSPMLIDWGQTPNPATTASGGCRLVRYEIGHPDGHALRRLCGQLEADVDVTVADRPYSAARIAGPTRPSVLTGFTAG